MDPLMLVPSSVSAIVGVLGFYLNHVRRISVWESARDSLQKISDTRTNRRATQDSNELLKWLANGDIIVPHLRTRLVTRFVTSLSIVAALGLITIHDGPGQVFSGLPAFEEYDFFVVAGQFCCGLFASSRFLMDKKEADFLARLAALRKSFYELFVVPAMVEFNYRMDDSIDFQNALKALRKENEEWAQQLKNDLEKTKYSKSKKWKRGKQR